MAAGELPASHRLAFAFDRVRSRRVRVVSLDSNRAEPMMDARRARWAGASPRNGPMETPRCNADLVERIETAINDAWSGDEGWDRLEASGSDEYLAACDVIEMVRILQRMIAEGHASERVIADVRAGLLLDQEGDR